MNISKNILSLGLIAVISGISTAQTYTATAGTNGATDIQSDYSMSTGDGASVSVDVPLEFELPKKVAIAISTPGTNLTATDGSFILPSNPMFDGIDSFISSTSLSQVLDLTPLNSSTYANLSTSTIYASGGIYANTPFSITADVDHFTHESDPNSIIEIYKGFVLGKKVVNSGTIDYKTYGGHNNTYIADDGSFPKTFSVDETALITEGNKFTFSLNVRAYLDTVDPTDRAGKYFSTAIFTVTTL